ncbi:MAG: DUF86 domain-containing protein [Methanosarcinales archaeon]|nr:MAG: DUF86 domain-containing protein [Methanosarcinales archaeon]
MDIERIIDKMDDLEKCLRELEEYLPEGVDAYLRSGLRRRACERAFQLACENLLDICNMIISDEGLGMPRDSRDSVQKIASHNMISESLASRIGELIGFRNLIVHQYGRVDDCRAHKQMYGESGDFYEFLEEIERFITSKRDESGERLTNRDRR